MQIVRKTLAVFLSLWLIAPSAGAQQTHVADRAALDQAVAAAAARAEADRAAIRRVLARQEVKDVAARLGVDMTRADSAVRLLDGAELTQAAEYASQIEQDLAGGATTVVITATTIIIILLIIIIIVLLAD
jgi:branched-subunit amino acid ABC-type transport system permease component